MLKKTVTDRCTKMKLLHHQQLQDKDEEFDAVNLQKYSTINRYNAATCFIQLKQYLLPSQCHVCENKKYKSNIQQVIPTIFLPPLLVFVNDASSIQIADQSQLNKGCHFGSLTLTSPLKMKLPKEMSMKHFNAYYPDKTKLIQRICLFCMIHFSLKAGSLRHPSHQHPRKRSRDDAFDDIDYRCSD